MIGNLNLQEINKIDISDNSEFPFYIQMPDKFESCFLWVHENKNYIMDTVQKYGAVLLRGSALKSASQFGAIVRQFNIPLCQSYGDLPVFNQDIDYVFRSTPYPAEQAILFHNEASHTAHWPHYQWFFCLTPPKSNGETPIVDCKKVYDRLLPLLKCKFQEVGLKYTRNFIHGLDVSWKTFFGVHTIQELEEFCESNEIKLTKKFKNIVQTEIWSPAVIKHPSTHDFIFFNQLLLHHHLILNKTTYNILINMFGLENFPRRVAFGDGDEIDLSILNYVLNTFTEESICFDWCQGDILLLDNFRVAHARRGFTGERKICVALSELIHRNKVLL